MSKQALRRTWFQLHKWIGLLLAILIIPISVSGAVLVWHEEIEQAIHPERFATTGSTTIGADAYLTAARREIGSDARIASLAMPDHGGAVVVTAAGAPGRGGPPVRTSVYLDPPSARVLDMARSNEGMLRFLHVLHGSLYVPGMGRQIVGWMGFWMERWALTGSFFGGVAMGGWTRGLHRARWREDGANLHHQAGSWVGLRVFLF